MYKLYIGFSILLLFIISGQIYYLFVYKKANSPSKVTQSQQKKTNSVPTESPQKPPSEVEIVSDFIEYNKYLYEQGAMISSTSEYTFEYVLDDIQLFNTADKADLTNAASIAYKTSDGKRHTVTFKNYDLKRTLVLEKKDDIERIIQFAELKKGDKIRYYIVLNNFAEPSLSTEQITITRL